MTVLANTAVQSPVELAKRRQRTEVEIISYSNPYLPFSQIEKPIRMEHCSIFIMSFYLIKQRGRIKPKISCKSFEVYVLLY